MARTIDEILEKYFRYIYPKKTSIGISNAVNTHKKKLGNNIVSRFSSYFSDDEELYGLFYNCTILENIGLLYWLFGSFHSFIEWVVCITNQKIVAFSQGLGGSNNFNQAIKIIYLKDVQSVQGITFGHFINIQSGQIKYSIRTQWKNINFEDDFNRAQSFLELLNKRLDALSEMNTIAPSYPIQQALANNTMEQLERLSQLYQQGILTEQEFQIQKKKILENR